MRTKALWLTFALVGCTPTEPEPQQADAEPATPRTIDPVALAGSTPTLRTIWITAPANPSSPALAYPRSRMFAWIELDDWQTELGIVRDSEVPFADSAVDVVWFPAEFAIDDGALDLRGMDERPIEASGFAVLISPTACRAPGPAEWLTGSSAPPKNRPTEHWTDFGGACIKPGDPTPSWSPRASLEFAFSHPGQRERPPWTGAGATLVWTETGDLGLDLEAGVGVVGKVRRLRRWGGGGLESFSPIVGSPSTLLEPNRAALEPDRMDKPEAVYAALDWRRAHDVDEFVELWIEQPGPVLRLTSKLGFEPEIEPSSVVMLVVPPRSHERGHWRWVYAAQPDGASKPSKQEGKAIAAMRAAGIDECLFTLPGLGPLGEYRAKISLWQGPKGLNTTVNGIYHEGLQACIEQTATGLDLGLAMPERVDFDLKVE